MFSLVLHRSFSFSMAPAPYPPPLPPSPPDQHAFAPMIGEPYDLTLTSYVIDDHPRFGFGFLATPFGDVSL